ncbi:MAG: hypothetical protein RL648_664, partial [Verrucomicrobiota bacterium]
MAVAALFGEEDGAMRLEGGLGVGEEEGGVVREE